jgi:SAM-dependent methyltransferase
MEHLVVNPLVYLSELRRVLAPRGSLFITTPNAAGLHKLIPILLGRSTYFPLAQLFATSYSNGSLYHRHNREFTMAELTEILETSGFILDESEFFSAYKRRFLKPRRPGESFFRSIGRSFAYRLMDIFPSRRDTLFVIASPNERDDHRGVGEELNDRQQA